MERKQNREGPIIKTNQRLLTVFYARFISTVMMCYKSSFFSPFCLPFGKAAVLTNSRIPRSPALVYTRACQSSHVDGCCLAAAYGIRPWTPWIWGILNFRSIRVIVFPFGTKRLSGTVAKSADRRLYTVHSCRDLILVHICQDDYPKSRRSCPLP